MGVQHRERGSQICAVFRNIEDLGRLDWRAIGSWNWKDVIVRERKQAEALIEGHLPWRLIEQIGVVDTVTAAAVTRRLDRASHKPAVSVERNWYY